MTTGYVTKDSGERVEFASGMRRDVQTGKPRFDLLLPGIVGYEEQLLTRVAGLLARGAEKYGDNNWTLANSEEELARFKSSGYRHFVQWITGETDEDHAAAVVFNLLAHESIKAKLAGVEEVEEVDEHEVPYVDSVESKTDPVRLPYSRLLVSRAFLVHSEHVHTLEEDGEQCVKNLHGPKCDTQPDVSG